MKKLKSKDIYDSLILNGIGYYCGVPDSIVNPLSLFLSDNAPNRHCIAANEGNAVAIAAGYHIATGEVPLVYMQNSGLSNAIDPLASLIDPTVLSIPMLLFIGWRGQPGTSDEPQHAKQGAITTQLLDDLSIPYCVLSRSKSRSDKQIKDAVVDANEHQRPYAILLEKDIFEEYKPQTKNEAPFPLTREDAVHIVTSVIKNNDVIISGIGKVSRELYDIRDNSNQNHSKDLLIVGGMGHASSIAFGIASQMPSQRVYCFDGDGAALMHLGAMATIGSANLSNFCQIVFNNGLHDSVGGQKTVGLQVSLTDIASACGYSHVVAATSEQSIRNALSKALVFKGSTFLEICVQGGARDDLPRPKITPISNKLDVMAHLASN